MLCLGGLRGFFAEGSGQQEDSVEESRAFQGQNDKQEAKGYPILPVPPGAALKPPEAAVGGGLPVSWGSLSAVPVTVCVFLLTRRRCPSGQKPASAPRRPHRGSPTVLRGAAYLLKEGVSEQTRGCANGMSVLLPGKVQ